MAPTNARPARTSARSQRAGARLPRAHVALLILLSFSLILAACESTGGASGLPTATRAPIPVGPAPTRLPFAAALTAEARDTPYVIERVTLATNVDEQGVPLDEVTSIPADSRQMFLSVLVTGLQPPVRFRAFWFEGDQIIGQSEEMVEESGGPARWVSLGFRTNQDLNPARLHAVELRINNRLVDSYTFRVGTGELEDVLAEAVVSLGTRDGEPVEPGQTFDVFAPQIVVVARVSEKVDPSGMVFSAALYRGDTLIEQRPPDGGQLQLPAEPTPADRTMTFTYLPDTSFAPGNYHITLRLNGTEIRTLPFTVLEERRPTPTPTQSRSGPTPTPVSSGISLLEIMLTEQLDPNTGEPAGESIDEWDGNPNQQKQFWLSLQLSDVRIDDVVEVDVLLWDRHINRHRYPAAAFEQGWLSVPVDLWAPPISDGPKRYYFLIFINGVQIRSYRVDVDNDPPPPTATPAPSATATVEG